MEAVIKFWPALMVFIIMLVAALTDGFDFTLYREQKNKTKER
jgi:preprotein translocase subunit YajC